MTAIVFLVEQLASGLYLLFILGILWYGRKFLLSRREYRATQFELERELARYRQINAVTAVILLLEFTLIVFGIQTQVMPIVREHTNVAASRPGVIEDGTFNTPTPAPAAEQIDVDPVGSLGEDDPANQVLATPTLTPTPVGTIIPNMGPVEGCQSDNASLQIPANGMLVHKPELVRGTAYTEDFAEYSIEIKGPSTFGEYIVLDRKQIPVRETSELSQFTPSGFDPGDYQFRLAVFDITGAMQAVCMVNIRISEPIPTATPLGQ